MRSKKGFTLIELVVVMAIIAVLALLIVAAIAAARRQSITTQRTGNVKTIETALESRASKCSGKYFATTTTCATAVSTTDIGSVQNSLVNGGFLSQTLGLTGAESGYTFTGDAAANTFTIRACSFPDTTCTDTTAAYRAIR